MVCKLSKSSPALNASLKQADKNNKRKMQRKQKNEKKPRNTSRNFSLTEISDRFTMRSPFALSLRIKTLKSSKYQCRKIFLWKHSKKRNPPSVQKIQSTVKFLFALALS